jgi:arylsulfatase A-like enzyme
MVHQPLAASDDFRGKSGAGLLGDAIQEVDWSVGRILQTLKDLELDRKTLVIFTSDNGAAAGSSAPWRGKKASIYEGGVREPCIMRWPGQIPAKTTCSHIAGNIDVLPTFANLVGAELPKGRILDGRDITSLMFRADAPPVRDTHLYFTGNGDLGAIRQGDWKLFLKTPAQPKPKAEKGKEKDADKKPTGDKLVLYNLAKDPTESTDVAADHPDIVTRLREEAEKRGKEIKEHRRPAGTVKAKN